MKLGRNPEEMKKILRKIKQMHRSVNFWYSIVILLFFILISYSLYLQFSPLDWPRIEPISPDRKSQKPIPPSESSPDSSEAVPPARTSRWCQRTFRVVCGNNSGSGFLITPEYLLTNAHVIKGCNKVTIFFDQSTEELEGNVVWRGTPNGKKEDIAVVQIPHQKESYVLPLGNSSSDVLPQGSDIIVGGYQLGEPECAISKGTLTTRKLSHRLLVVDATMNIGHSGGPTISEEQEAVIGLNVSESDGITSGGRIIQGVNNSIEINYIKKFIPRKYLP